MKKLLTPGNIILRTANNSNSFRFGGRDLFVRRSMFCTSHSDGRKRVVSLLTLHTGQNHSSSPSGSLGKPAHIPALISLSPFTPSHITYLSTAHGRLVDSDHSRAHLLHHDRPNSKSHSCWHPERDGVYTISPDEHQLLLTCFSKTTFMSSPFFLSLRIGTFRGRPNLQTRERREREKTEVRKPNC